MGRYTTVQAFKDTDTRVPALSYEVATGQALDEKTGEGLEGKQVKKKPKVEYDEHGRKKGLTEKVVNAYGSTAGAGSGEFHTYRHARDREKRRLERNLKVKLLTEAQKTWQRKLEKNQQECDKKTAKRRNERKRKKEAKRLAKIRRDLNQKAGIIETRDNGQSSTGTPSPKPMTGKSTSKVAGTDKDGGDEKRMKLQSGSCDAPKIAFEPPRNRNAIPNDGSFLETFSKTR